MMQSKKYTDEEINKFKKDNHYYTFGRCCRWCVFTFWGKSKDGGLELFCEKMSPKPYNDDTATAVSTTSVCDQYKEMVF